MRTGIKQILFLIYPAILFGLLLSACTNDLKKIQEISAKEVNSPADTTTGVDLILSDSAHVKARILSPLLLDYQQVKSQQPYRYMPKGVKIILFDKTLQPTVTIVADTAYDYETTKITKLIKNVVVTNAKGDVFKSDELVWDQNTHKITSSKPVDITMANGNVGHGTAMETNESFNPFTLQNQTGLIYIDPKYEQ